MGTTTERAAHDYRWPWYWLVVLGALAIAGTAAIIFGSQSRLRAIDESFAASQTVRLQQVVHRIDDYFACANQLTMSTGNLAAKTVGDMRRVRWFVAQLFESRRDANVYGLGVFYAPDVWPGGRLANVYDHQSGRLWTRYTHRRVGFDEVLYVGPGRGTDDYVSTDWFRSAVRRHGVVTYYGPYTEDGRSFISVVRAFYGGGRLEGVASVDILTAQFRAMLSKDTRKGDVAWAQAPDKRSFVSTGPLTKNRSDYRDASMGLAYSRGVVHLTRDAAPLLAAHRETVTSAIVAVAALWLLALCTAVGLFGRWRATSAASVLRADIAVAKRVEAELRKAAFTDDLTGLPNRAAFLETGARLLEDRRSDHAVLLVDLDRFNITNETLGHPAGDELLRILAARLRASLPSGAFVGRLGGDEFAMLVPCGASEVYGLGEMILRVIAKPAVLYGRTIYPQASIGIAIVDDSYDAAQELLRDADIAMYAAKNRGRARCSVFDTEMRLQVALDAELELDLRRAIEHGDIVPHYQPIVELSTGAVRSFEALARWQRGGEALLGAAFVPFAESRGFVHQIDAAVQRAALAQAASILALFPGCNIAFNVSATELTSPLFAEQFRELLNEYSVEPRSVRLEITETAMMTRADEAHKMLKALVATGVSVVLDDFGTGYSSLSYLQRLPISGVKIDRSFVEEIDSDERSREIVRSIVALADVLDLTTTAEGVERIAQVEALRTLDVTYGQGFFFSPAIAMSHLSDLAIVDDRRAAQ